MLEYFSFIEIILILFYTAIKYESLKMLKRDFLFLNFTVEVIKISYRLPKTVLLMHMRVAVDYICHDTYLRVRLG
jgi:hypothetical protein